MKDAKGHGSNRHGSAVSTREGNRRDAVAARNAQLIKAGQMTNQLEQRDRDDAYLANKRAADALASGAKSAPAPTHDGMSGIARSESVLRGMNEAAVRAGVTPRQGFGNTNVQSPRYNAGAVDKAIASSNRAGRRIGGKEASAIHRLLKGRH